MTVAALDSGGWGQGWVLGAAVVSFGLHAILAFTVANLPERIITGPVWVEMAMAEVAPEPVAPEPVPEPVAPEPEKPPEVVQYDKDVVEPPPVAPEAKPVPRVVQGIDNNSFLPGTGAGTARAGTTTAVKATTELMTQEEATGGAVVPFASVTVPPKVKFKGVLEVPESVRAVGLVGRVEVLLTVDAEGRVSEVAVVGSLSPEADAACMAAMRQSRWKPGDRDGTPVITKGVPYSCKFEMTPD